MKMNRNEALKRMAWASTGALALPGMAWAVNPRTTKSKADGTTAGIAGALKDSALIIVDMQNDFVRVGAPLEVPSARETINAQKQLIQAFRKRNLPVLFTKFLSRPHYYLLWNWSPQCEPPTKCCWKGHQRFYKDIGAQ